MLKKIYKMPAVISSTRWHVMVAFYPKYDERHLTIFKNDFGISPTPMQPEIVKMVKCGNFDINRYAMSDYSRRKWQKLCGDKAYIYALVKENTPYYIGSTKNLKNRQWQHLRAGCTSILKSTRDNASKAKMIVLCECPIEFQFDEEKRWILGAKNIFKLKNIVHN